MTPKKRTREELENQINSFNNIYNIGHIVKIQLDNGEIREVTVKAPASMIGSIFAVGWFHEVKGCYSLDRVVK